MRYLWEQTSPGSRIEELGCSSHPLGEAGEDEGSSPPTTPAPGLARARQDIALASYLVVGDLFLLSQWTASKKAAFQNRRVCLQDKETALETGAGMAWGASAHAGAVSSQRLCI